MSGFHGEFLWYELMTSDPQAAIAFYTAVVGWGTTTWEGGPTPYTMWTAGESALGGVMQLPEEARKAGSPPHWLGYVGTTSVDESLSMAQGMGGRTLLPPMDIPTVGRIGVFADPHGAVLGLYTPQGETPPPGAPEVGRFSWNELMAGELDPAVQFYGRIFGWDKTMAMDMGEVHGIYQMYGKAERTFGGMMKRPAEMPASAWIFYIKVPDIRAALDRVASRGGHVLNGPMEVPGGDLVAQCVDPQGAMFALHQSVAA